MIVGTDRIDPTEARSGESDNGDRFLGESAKTSDQVGVAAAVRATILELMKYGLLEEASKPNLYRNALQHRDEVDRVLRSLDLAVRIDDIRGLAFVVVSAMPNQDDDEWSHPLVRRQRLTLEQSLLVAILRQQFVAHEVEAGVGAGDARVALDDLIPHLQAYLGDLGSDAQERKRLLTLLEQLKGHGIVSDVDQQERVTIRPIIAHLANPENLANLVQALRDLTQKGDVGSTSEEATDE
jgi:hypothetical protein